MRVLVTGSSGFLAGKLIPELQRAGHEVTGLDKVDSPRAFPRALVDITNDAAVASFRQDVTSRGSIDACVHLAAVAAPRQAAADPKLAWDTNVRGTHNVLKLCSDLGVKKVVFASSAHVYGISPKYMPTDETHPLSLLDTYTVTKILGERLCRLFHDNYGLSCTWLRLFNAYGPGQSPDYFIGKKISQARDGKLMLMNAAVTKDWVWADDVARAMRAAVETSYVGPINVGTGKETSLGQIAERIASHFRVQIENDSSVDEGPTRMCCDWRLAERVLGWRPSVDFLDGLRQVIESSTV